MSTYLITITTFIYFWVSVDLYFQNKYGLSIAYLGYAFANIGLIIAAK
jgi:hypothetical protein